MEKEISQGMMLRYFVGLFLLSIFFLGKLMMPFFSIIIMAMVFTGVLSPVHRFFCKKLKPNYSSLLICIFIFFILLVPMVMFGGILTKEAYELYLLGKSVVIGGNLKGAIENSNILVKINKFLLNFDMQITINDLNKWLSEAGKIVGLFLFNQLSLITSNFLNFIANFFLMLLTMYYLFIEGPKLIDFIIDLSPLPKEQDEKLIKKFEDMSGAILIGNGVGGIIQGVSGGIVFAVFGLTSPFLWGVIMSLLAFLPIIGIGVVFLPAAIYLFLIKRTAAGVFFVLFYFFISWSIEYYYKPKLVGERVEMHSLFVFFSIIGGLKMFGILGIIYGPLIFTAFVTLTDIYHLNYQKHIVSDN